MKKFTSKTVKVGDPDTTGAKALKTANMKKKLLRKKPEAKPK